MVASVAHLYGTDMAGVQRVWTGFMQKLVINFAWPKSGIVLQFGSKGAY